jgi:hypothetical protein
MAAKSIPDTTTKMSAFGEEDIPWQPEKESPLGLDVVPVREPMAITLMRVGARLPQSMVSLEVVAIHRHINEP